MEDLGEGRCCGAAGPPTALQNPGGMDGEWVRRGGRTGGREKLTLWCGNLRDDGRRLFESFSSWLGFTVDCQLIEMVNANCFLKAGNKRGKQL